MGRGRSRRGRMEGEWGESDKVCMSGRRKADEVESKVEEDIVCPKEGVERKGRLLASCHSSFAVGGRGRKRRCLLILKP